MQKVVYIGAHDNLPTKLQSIIDAGGYIEFVVAHTDQSSLTGYTIIYIQLKDVQVNAPKPYSAPC